MEWVPEGRVSLHGGAAPRASEAPLRVLLLEDRADDAELVKRELGRAGLNPVTHVVDSRDGFTRALREFMPDVVLSDHSLSQFNPVAALEVLRDARPTVPLIVVAGALDEKLIVEALRGGAEDYVLKSNLSRLGPAIVGALSVRRPLEKLSPRQLEVLRLLADGHPTREIARRLGVSVKTIETHRAEIMRRLEIRDLAGLVRYAVRVGLVSVAA